VTVKCQQTAAESFEDDVILTSEASFSSVPRDVRIAAIKLNYMELAKTFRGILLRTLVPEAAISLK